MCIYNFILKLRLEIKKSIFKILWQHQYIYIEEYIEKQTL